MGADQPIFWDGIVVRIHPSHRMVDAPDQMGTECAGCGDCTCHGLAELTRPCSYILDYTPRTRDPAPQGRWDRVYASARDHDLFDDAMLFTIEVQTPAGESCGCRILVEKSELERDPGTFGRTFDGMVKRLDEELPPF